MATLDEIRAFVRRLTPEGICDDCVAQCLSLEHPGDVERAARELSGSRGIERARGNCILAAHLRCSRAMPSNAGGHENRLSSRSAAGSLEACISNPTNDRVQPDMVAAGETS